MHETRDFISTNLNLLARRMLHSKYQCIPAGGSREEDFSRFIKIVLTLPLLGQKRGQPLYLNKFESRSPKHVSCQVWLKLAQWFLRRSRLKEKVDAGRTDGRTDAAPYHKLSMAFGQVS